MCGERTRKENLVRRGAGSRRCRCTSDDVSDLSLSPILKRAAISEDHGGQTASGASSDVRCRKLMSEN